VNEFVLARELERDRYAWLHCRTDAAPSAGADGYGDAAALAQACGGLPVVLLADGRRMLLAEVEVPSRNERTALAAVPYMLEEQLAGDLDGLSFHLGGRPRSGARPVAVMSAAELEALKAPLTAAGLHLAAVVPDFLALPEDPDGWTALIDPPRVLVRTGPGAGFAADADQIGPILRRRIAENAALPARIRCYATPGAADAAAIDPGDPAVEVHRDAVQVDPMALFAIGLGEGVALNLHPQGLAPAGWSGASKRRMWAAAALILAALLGHAALALVNVVRLEHEQQRIAAESERLFREAFPEVGRIVDLRVQATRELEKMQAMGAAGPRFVEVLALLGEALREAPALEVELAGVNYREGVTDLSVRAAAVQDVQSYRDRLGRAPLQVDVVSAEQQHDGGLIGRIRLQERSL
jgi:general secretion pathway protein L